MLDISNIFSRFTSRLAIAFIAMIWAVVTYPDANSWVFVAGYGIFAIGYMVVKTSQPTINEELKPIVTRSGKFNEDDIGGGK